MSEFERKKRYLKYNDPECVIFLRKDFNHQCAYCLTKEADLGNPNNFQKDHFVPQKGGYSGTVHKKYYGEKFDVNSYYNLYYSCSRCNGRGGKTNTWSSNLLDPCLDKIWGKHLQLNIDLVESLTPQGKEYIETFQLNSIIARKLREKIRTQNEIIVEHINKLEELKQNAQIDDVLLEYLNEQIEKESAKLKYGIKYMPNDYFYNDKEIKEVESILNNYKCKYLSGDYELDYEIEFKNNIYQIYLRIHDSISFTDGYKIYYLPINQVKDWQDKEILICHYDSENKKLYYIEFTKLINCHPIKTDNKYMYTIKEDQTL